MTASCGCRFRVLSRFALVHTFWCDACAMKRLRAVTTPGRYVPRHGAR